MKIRGTTKPMKEVIPKDPANGVLQDKVHEWIGKVEVIDVSDLHTFCRENPDLECADLADMIDEGEFR